MSSLVLHIDIDAFFASVEQLRNPSLRGKPVAVGSGVVASASYEARRFGLRAGTTLRKARELCPNLIIIVGHAPIYHCFSERIFEICSEYSPVIETFLDEAYCDWSGMERLYPDPLAVALKIRERVLQEVGLSVTVGLGRNRMFAKLATKSAKPGRSSFPAPSPPSGTSSGTGSGTSPDSLSGASSSQASPRDEGPRAGPRPPSRTGARFRTGKPPQGKEAILPGPGPAPALVPPGEGGRSHPGAEIAQRTESVRGAGTRRILPEEEETFLRDLPVRSLPGIGPRTEKLLAKLNIQTVGEMRMLSRDSLRSMLGLPGAILYERCRGEDAQPISEREVPRSIRRETSFHEDTIEREAIEGTLYYLTERAANTLRGLRLEARQLGVKIRYRDFIEESATRRLPAPTQLDSELFALGLEILRMLYTRRVALHLIGVSLTGFVRDTGFRQLELFPDQGFSQALQDGSRAARPGPPEVLSPLHKIAPPDKLSYQEALSSPEVPSHPDSLSSSKEPSSSDGLSLPAVLSSPEGLSSREEPSFEGTSAGPAGFLPPEAPPVGQEEDRALPREARAARIHVPRKGIADQRRELSLLESLDEIRRRYGYASVVCGRSLHLLGKLEQDDHGFILRTSSLTR